MRRASALLMALWTIAVLSIMVLSFAAEAHLQSGINVYVRERNRVNRLTDAGQQLAEVVLCDYQNAPEWTDGEDASALMEDDRWVFEKRELKTATRCMIGPVLLDEDNPESGTVEVEIEISNAGQENSQLSAPVGDDSADARYSGGTGNAGGRDDQIVEYSHRELERLAGRR